MKTNTVTRREFMRSGAAGLAGAGLLAGGAASARPTPRAAALAVNGGTPVRTTPFATWPQIFADEERQVLDVLKTGKWFRGEGKRVSQFEQAFATTTGARYCVATASGTTALLTGLHAVDVQPGDEVLVSSYTFIASASVIVQHGALPVFVDSDPHTFQLDPDLIEAKITDRTRAVIPVHHGGYPCDMDKIMAVARKRNIAVVEDACQAHLAQYKGKNVGCFGDVGCFSFQVSKNLPAGEGGACIGDNESLMDACRWYHDVGVNRKKPAGFALTGTNFRMTEWQGAVLQEQLKGLEERANHRHANAVYLCELVKDLEGFAPAKFVEGGNRGAYYNFQARFYPDKFKGLPREKFTKALGAEGIPCWSGWKMPLNREGFVETALQSRGFKRLFSPEEMARYRRNQDCPVSDQICASMVQFSQRLLLGPRSDMEQIAEAIHKIYQAAETIG